MQTIENPDSLEQLPNGLTEAIAAADTITVEIGTSRWPLFETQKQGGINENNLYIGINIDPAQHASLQSKLRAIHGFALYDLPSQKSPLPDNVADLVYLSNVFGEPDQGPSVAYTEYDGEADHDDSALTFDDKSLTLDKAWHMLKPTGQLVVLETITPYNDDKMSGVQAMTKLLENHGYSITESISWADQDWSERVAAYDNPQHISNWGAYMVVAAKH